MQLLHRQGKRKIYRIVEIEEKIALAIVVTIICLFCINFQLMLSLFCALPGALCIFQYMSNIRPPLNDEIMATNLWIAILFYFASVIIWYDIFVL